MHILYDSFHYFLDIMFLNTKPDQSLDRWSVTVPVQFGQLGRKKVELESNQLN